MAEHVSGLLAASLLVPLLVAFFDSAWRIPEFSPRQIVYAKDVFPLVFAPWAAPTGITRAASRLLQAALLLRLPAAAILPCYAHWVVVALTRTLTGFLLTRSVGWAYPRMFNHWALYETSSGVGPALATYLLTSGARPTLDFVRGSFKSRHWDSARAEVISVACACTILCWLDNAPWTYSISVLLALAWAFWRAWLTPSAPHGNVYVPFSSDAQQTPNSPLRRPRMGMQACLMVLLMIFLPSISTFLLSRSRYPPVLPASSGGGLLLQILVLSFPRPNDDTSGSTTVLSQTISSYLPYIDNNSVELSVFTHAKVHPSFERAKQEFRGSPVVFHADLDSHPDAWEGQYLHVAEAFRWAYEGRGEWVMLVEDDFPLCGEWGWGGVAGVMNILESGRTTPDHLGRRGGFIGTGGRCVLLFLTGHSTMIHVLKWIDDTPLRSPDSLSDPPDPCFGCLAPRPWLPPATDRHHHSGLPSRCRSSLSRLFAPWTLVLPVQL